MTAFVLCWKLLNCEQFGPRSGPTKCLTLTERIFQKLKFLGKNISSRQKIMITTSSMQRINDLNNWTRQIWRIYINHPPLLSEKRYSLTFDPTPWVKGVSVGKIVDTMLRPASSALIRYATWLLSEKDIVWPFDPTPWIEGVSVGKMFATMLLPVSSALIWYATWPYSEKV